MRLARPTQVPRLLQTVPNGAGVIPGASNEEKLMSKRWSYAAVVLVIGGGNTPIANVPIDVQVTADVQGGTDVVDAGGGQDVVRTDVVDAGGGKDGGSVSEEALAAP